ncbi:hypothetical protein KY290_010107 [Solanum tuberosum]|uniref:Uncharacterized protein n=1 Tax=Solanum tuberosum TaxID=4113 RepID=A0ABQ7VXH5_SOLTU|nr:hypothetical protein KY290_010107 [Solanum tuberosum]
MKSRIPKAHFKNSNLKTSFTILGETPFSEIFALFRKRKGEIRVPVAKRTLEKEQKSQCTRTGSLAPLLLSVYLTESRRRLEPLLASLTRWRRWGAYRVMVSLGLRLEFLLKFGEDAGSGVGWYYMCVWVC